jgi:MFS transporter, ACS family, glucarate transporter
MLPAASSATARMTHVRWQVIAALFVFSFLTIVDRVAISAAQADISRDLGISQVAFGFVFGVFALGYSIFQVPSGGAADYFGPRLFLTFIVVLWSLFTGLTGIVTGLGALIVIRFLFGAAEAGIYPTSSRAIYNWVPRRSRGTAQGALFIGSRLGAAFGLSAVSFLMVRFGWRQSFWILAVAGAALAIVWYLWFRNTPEEKSGVSQAELELIRSDRGDASAAAQGRLLHLLTTPNALLLMVQYFASNFTFFLAFSWLLPYLRMQYQLSPAEAGAYASIPLYFGAFAHWVSGITVDWLYRKGYWRASRQGPAIAGFALGALSLLAAASAPTIGTAVFWFSLATLGVDLTLAPSWTTCQDIAGPRTGTLSGAMNMLGNAGSFVSSITFPWLLTVTGSAATYFYVAAAVNVIAILAWWRIRWDGHTTRSLT